jgi:M6 family metalloprotease-like protein
MSPHRIRWIALGLFLMGTTAGWALEPPSKADLEQYLRDGTLFLRQRNAWILGNHLIDTGLVQDFRARLAGLRPGAGPLPMKQDIRSAGLPGGRRGLPTKGSVKIFALLLDFPDYPAAQSRDTIDNQLFGTGDINNWPRESLRSYYRRSSYNMLDIGGATLGWYRAGYARSGMAMTTAARETLIKEALLSMDAAGHDFSVYDNDRNGVIDYFVVIWTGPDNGWSNFWWGYQTSFSNSNFNLDGKSFANAKYSWQWESRPVGGPFYPYVVIHETGHALGLPDYYDYDATVGPRGGVGGLDMMDANRGDHNAFSKFLLDWITPTVINIGREQMFLSPSATTAEAVIAMPEYDPVRPFDEFFVVQNRWRSENDAALPGDGLLIWHVDARLNSAGTNFLYNNSYSDHKLLRLMEADGREEIERGWSATAADYYIAGRSLRSTGLPASGRYDGSASGLSVIEISPPAPGMTFTVDIRYNLFPPQTLTRQRIESDYIFTKEYIEKLAWLADARNRTEILAYRISAKPSTAGENAWSVLTELSGSTFVYDHRGLKKIDLYDYRIVAVDRNGVESEPRELRR